MSKIGTSTSPAIAPMHNGEAKKPMGPTSGANPNSFASAVRQSQSVASIDPDGRKSGSKQSQKPFTVAKKEAATIPAYETVGILSAGDALQNLGQRYPELADALDICGDTYPDIALIAGDLGKSVHENTSALRIGDKVYVPIDLFSAWENGTMEAGRSADMAKHFSSLLTAY